MRTLQNGFSAIFLFFCSLVFQVHGTPAVGNTGTTENRLNQFSTPPEEYLFVSYNLRNWLKMERVYQGEIQAPRPKPAEEVEAVLKILKDLNPHVLGVCEIGRQGDLEELQAKLKEIGLEYPYLELASGGDPSRALGLLSRFPIIQRHSRSDLTYQLGPHLLPLQRGILDVTIEFPNQQVLRLMGFHFKSKRDVDNLDQSEMRNQESRLLREHAIQAVSRDPQTPLILYGDVNDSRESFAVRRLQGKFDQGPRFTDLPLADSRGDRWTHFWAKEHLYSRFDYVFVNAAAQSWIQLSHSGIYDEPLWSKGSDHRPIFIRLKPPRSSRTR